jgi:hypothetical protein
MHIVFHIRECYFAYSAYFFMLQYAEYDHVTIILHIILHIYAYLPAYHSILFHIFCNESAYFIICRIWTCHYYFAYNFAYCCTLAWVYMQCNMQNMQKNTQAPKLHTTIFCICMQCHALPTLVMPSSESAWVNLKSASDSVSQQVGSSPSDGPLTVQVTVTVVATGYVPVPVNRWYYGTSELIWNLALYDIIYDIIWKWYWPWYHRFWNVYDTSHRSTSIISYDYDIIVLCLWYQ